MPALLSRSGASIAAQALLFKELLLKPIPSKDEGLYPADWK
jgi:hypothetical protein